MSKTYTVSVIITRDLPYGGSSPECKSYASEFKLTRDDLDNTGIMALKATDAMQYLAQEMKKNDIKTDDRN